MDLIKEMKSRVIQKIKENVQKQKKFSDIDEDKLDLFEKRSISKINTINDSLLCMHEKEQNEFIENIKNSINQEIDDLFDPVHAKWIGE